MQTTTTTTNGKSTTPAPVPLSEALALSLIDESPTNPRKTFTGVEDLAADVKLHGILQPVLVRPRGKRFELVFGGRRFRAAKIAGLKAIPVMVRELTDAEALEIQIVENSQRADIHPLEEADGYRALTEQHGFSVEDVAAKVGKSPSAIYARLKLCALIEEGRKAFFDGKLTAATALVIARIPHEDLQRKALKEIAFGYRGDDEPMNARQAGALVRREFMLRLVDAPFDRGDASLVPGAPACSGCPKRTGNQKELFADLALGKDDLCTDPKCFAAKRDAAWAKQAARAKDAGKEVLDDKAAKKVFAPYGGLARDAGFVDLNATEWDPHAGKSVPLRSRLPAAQLRELPVTLARDANGVVHELVDKAKFTALQRAERKDRKPSAAEKKREAELDADRRRREREGRARQAKISAVVTAAEGRQPNEAFWRTLACAIALNLDWSVDELLERRGALGPKDKCEDIGVAFGAYVGTLTGSQARGLVVELLVESPYHQDGLAYFEELFGLTKRK